MQLLNVVNLGTHCLHSRPSCLCSYYADEQGPLPLECLDEKEGILASVGGLYL